MCNYFFYNNSRRLRNEMQLGGGKEDLRRDGQADRCDIGGLGGEKAKSEISPFLWTFIAAAWCPMPMLFRRPPIRPVCLSHLSDKMSRERLYGSRIITLGVGHICLSVPGRRHCLIQWACDPSRQKRLDTSYDGRQHICCDGSGQGQGHDLPLRQKAVFTGGVIVIVQNGVGDVHFFFFFWNIRLPD